MRKIFVIFAVVIFLCGCNRQEIYLPTEFDTAGGEEIYAVFPCLENGFSMLLELGENDNIMVSCGGSGDFPDLYDFLRHRGVKKINALVLLSDNEANTGGLPKLTANFEVGEVYVGEGMRDTDKYKRFCTVNSPGDCNFYIASEGTRIYDKNGVTIDVVSSRVCDTSRSSLSAMSLYVSFNDTAMFIEGDGDYVAERDIISTMGESIEADVIVVPHGSAEDLPSPELLSKVRPRYAVMPVYNGNYPLRRLTKAIEESGAGIIRTDTDGAIVFAFDGKNAEYNIIK